MMWTSIAWVVRKSRETRQPEHHLQLQASTGKRSVYRLSEEDFKETTCGIEHEPQASILLELYQHLYICVKIESREGSQKSSYAKETTNGRQQLGTDCEAPWGQKYGNIQNLHRGSLSINYFTRTIPVALPRRLLAFFSFFFCVDALRCLSNVRGNN
jgi:hypothetical protein